MIDDLPPFFTAPADDLGEIAEVLAGIESSVDVANEPPEDIPWLVHTLMPADDGPACIFAPPGALKSWHLKHLCKCVVTGEPFLGRFAVQRRPRALYLNIDSGRKTFRNRIRRVGGANGFDILSIPSSKFSPALLRAILAKYCGGFVGIDSFVTIYHPSRANDPAEDMRLFIEGLLSLFAEFECAGAIVDHSHRPKEPGAVGDFYGNGQKLATFRTMWQITADAPVKGKPRTTKITCRKMSEGEEFAPVLSVVDFSQNPITFSTPLNGDAETRESSLESKVLEWVGRQTETFSKNSIEKASLGYRVVDIRRVVADLIDRGILVTAGTRGSGTTYRLSHVVPHVVPTHVVPIRNRDGTTWLDSDNMPTSSQSSDVVPMPDDMEPTDETVFG